MEAQKTLNSHSNPEEKEQHWIYHWTYLQIILQSHSNKNSMVLAPKQSSRGMDRKEDTDTKSHSYRLLILYKWVQILYSY
jgi:hypothetical protein